MSTSTIAINYGGVFFYPNSVWSKNDLSADTLYKLAFFIQVAIPKNGEQVFETLEVQKPSAANFKGNASHVEAIVQSSLDQVFIFALFTHTPVCI